MFLVARYWRGSMNVASMRLKKTHEEAVQYLKDSHPHDLETGFYRIYELSETEAPKLRKEAKKK